MAYLSPLLTNIVTAVKKASINLNRDFSEIEHLQNSIKGSLDFTKIAFDKIERGLRNELAKVLPTTPIVFANEKTPKGGTFLAVSAVDGLANFAHGNPVFAISVALIEGATVLSGVVYNPARDELFFAEKGKGAFKEGFRSHERLRVSTKQDLEGALVSVRINQETKEFSFDIVNNTLAYCNDIRVSGAPSLDLAYLAGGKLDAVIAPNQALATIAAGILLVKEAGGIILEINQKDTRTEDMESVFNTGNLLAVNFKLSQKIAKILK